MGSTVKKSNCTQSFIFNESLQKNEISSVCGQMKYKFILAAKIVLFIVILILVEAVHRYLTYIQQTENTDAFVQSVKEITKNMTEELGKNFKV